MQKVPSASPPGRGRSCSPSIRATLPSSTFLSDSGLGCNTHRAHGGTHTSRPTTSQTTPGTRTRTEAGWKVGLSTPRVLTVYTGRVRVRVNPQVLTVYTGRAATPSYAPHATGHAPTGPLSRRRHDAASKSTAPTNIGPRSLKQGNKAHTTTIANRNNRLPVSKTVPRNKRCRRTFVQR